MITKAGALSPPFLLTLDHAGSNLHNTALFKVYGADKPSQIHLSDIFISPIDFDQCKTQAKTPFNAETSCL